MNSWTFRAPAKTVLFGEWAVLQGSPAIATTLSSQFIVSASQTTSGDRVEFCLQDSSAGSVMPAVFFTHEAGGGSTKIHPAWQRCVRDLRYLSTRFELPGGSYSLDFKREWKIAEGFGSSSALSVNLLFLFLQLSNPDFRPPATSEERIRFAQDSLELAHILQQDGGSGIDLVSQILGGTLVYQRNATTQQRSARALDLSFPNNLVLLHTGRKTKTHVALAKHALSAAQRTLIESSVLKFLETQDWESAIAEHYEVFKKTPVTPLWIQEIRDDLLNKGFVHQLKTTGAGGGDALLILLRPAAADEFRAWADSHSFWISPLAFNAEGVSRL